MLALSVYTRSKTRTGQRSETLTLRGRLVSELRGDELRIGFRDWRRIGPKSDAGGIDPLLDATGQITTVTTRKGAFVRVEGLEAGLASIRAMTKGAPAEARPSLERLEQMAPALLTKEASELWSVLVQFWDGSELAIGDDYESDSRVPVTALPGESVRILAKIRAERRLPCPSGGGSCVQVRLRSEPDARDLQRIFKRLVSELALPEPQLAAMVGEMSAITEVVLVTEPKHLVPHKLTKIRTTRIAPGAGAPKDAKPRESRDETTWAFTLAER